MSCCLFYGYLLGAKSRFLKTIPEIRRITVIAELMEMVGRPIVMVCLTAAFLEIFPIVAGQ
jgi:hypothetical protein